ncbi:Hemopexin-like repeat [Sesbania bispinosa]|nr:Hemopexin-like repeat [Sesbania bispinosa]
MGLETSTLRKRSPSTATWLNDLQSSSAAWRGCASNFAHPVAKDIEVAQNWVDTVYQVNCREKSPPLTDIIYRTGVQDWDILHHVVRWDTRPYALIFETGFQAWPQEDTPNTTYYDLYDFVQNAGAPLNSSKHTRHAFISTTLNLDWLPEPSEDTLPEGEEIEVYRYEIYAPGGIWVAASINNEHYNYTAQDEVCFVGGIAPQYIRAAQLFVATREAGLRYVSIKKAGKVITMNGLFNPQSDPYKELPIQTPIVYYMDENSKQSSFMTKKKKTKKKQSSLSRQTYTPRNRGQKRDAALKWYGHAVADASPCFINAAFRSSRKNEAYIFMRNECALMNYAPATTDDWIVNGPLLICEGFPSLIGTPFVEYGIDCAFDTDDNEAFIFCGNLCAYIDYAPRTLNNKILLGPMTITAMFPFFKSTMFENGIDTAFRSTKSKEAYLFRGDQCALINYDSKTLGKIGKISDVFHSLESSIFANGIDAVFASHKKDEAYLFKGDHYTRWNFAPHTTSDHIMGKVKPIFPHWPSLRRILPRKNGGLDMHHHRYDT